MRQGAKYRAARVAAHLSLREVAAQLGMSPVRLGEFERGVSKPLDWAPLWAVLQTSTEKEKP